MPHARSARVPSRLAVVVALRGRGADGRLRVVRPRRTRRPRPPTSSTRPAPGTPTAAPSARPPATLQQALDVRSPGTTINLEPGSTARRS